MGNGIDYAAPGPFTELAGINPNALAGFAAGPVGICLPVRELVIQPRDAQALNIPADRFAENQLRPADVLVRRLLALDPAPLSAARAPDKRVVGTCRHFAVLSCALLRHHGVAARVRCGFATYFQPNQAVDHWIIEYVDGARWVRVDLDVLAHGVEAEHLVLLEMLAWGKGFQPYHRAR